MMDISPVPANSDANASAVHDNERDHMSVFDMEELDKVLITTRCKDVNAYSENKQCAICLFDYGK